MMQMSIYLFWCGIMFTRFPSSLFYAFVITGRITTYLPSGGPFVRMDSHVYPDYVVPPSYDSLLGKVIWLFLLSIFCSLLVS